MTPQIARAVAGGIAGTIGITVVLYVVAPWLVGHPMNIAAMLGGLLGVSATVGMFLHLLLGVVVFPLFYVAIVRPFLPGRPATQGAVYGVALWLLAEIAFFPAAGLGVFHAGGGGLAAVLGALVGHLLYGGLLGGIAGRWEPAHEVVGTSAPRRPAEERTEAAPVDRVVRPGDRQRSHGESREPVREHRES